MNESTEYYQHSREDLIPFIPDNYIRVLEIGCGEGKFWNLLKPEGIEIWGIEPNPSAAQKARTRAHQILESTFDQCLDKLPDDYFDLVICNDVIEHMPDHDWFFEQIKTKMTADAKLIGSMPNVRYYQTLRSLIFKKDWPYEDAGVLDRTHLRFFTARSMQRTFREHQFNIEKFAGVNSPGRFKVFILFLNILLLGTAMDSRFQQFGFRLSKTN
jgi:2-polyprenyl-3-methyl-5-hydroxy-6-metoxy-1,4-benzoquinol methylase